MVKIDRVVATAGLLAALVAAPGFAELKQVKLGVKGATCAT
jgi:hypothetical protein